MRPEQRAAVLAAKLRALVSGNWRRDASGLEPTLFPAGAGLVDRSDRVGWVLVHPVTVDRDPDDFAYDTTPQLPRGWLGGAIMWGARHDVKALHILADDLAGDDARKAEHFADAPRLWRVAGRDASPVVPTAHADPPVPDSVSQLFRQTIIDAGADVVVEHGIVRGEVLGLEVARVVPDHDGVPQLEIGVGRHDRLAQAMLYGTADVAESLRTAVLAILEHRKAHAGPHPANQLAPERWLRDILIRNPSSIGLSSLVPVAGTSAPRLKRPSPAMALGAREDGLPTVVVACSTGVDLDAVADAADARAVRASAASPLWLVLPYGDDLPALRALAARLAHPADVVTVPKAWRDIG
jgi:hypothetical protein